MANKPQRKDITNTTINSSGAPKNSLIIQVTVRKRPGTIADFVELVIRGKLLT